MNIWAPAAAKPGDKRPVIVFIYGGGGTIGSSGMANYDGTNMAKRGAVFVNFNYRVGMLGFMAHPGAHCGAGRALRGTTAILIRMRRCAGSTITSRASAAIPTKS